MRVLWPSVPFAFAATLFATGCLGSHESFIVTFRDPHSVAVVGREADGTGSQWIGEREQKSVVVYTFQHLRTSDDYESLSRQPDGSLLLSSTDHRLGVNLVLVDREGRMDRQDWPPDVFLNERSRARQQAFVPFLVRLGTGSAVRGWLATSWSNVAEVRKRSGADPRIVGGTFGGVTWLVLGTALAGFGSWLAIDSASREKSGTTALGVGLAALGLTCDAWTLYQLFGPSREEVVH